MANPITKIILTAVDKTKAAFASAKSGLGSFGTAAMALKGTLGSIFIGLSVAGFVGKVKQAVDAMDEAGKSAKAAGTTVQNFTGLQFAGGQSGVDDMQKALVSLVDSLDSARSGTGQAAEAFKALKIDPTAFTDSSDALDVLADRFAKMPDGIDKTALAIDVFGKRVGPQMIPLLNQGSAGIRRLKDEAAALGIVIGDDAAAAAEQFNDNMDKLRTASSGLGIKLANEIVPGLNQVTAAMIEAAKEGDVLKTFWVGLGGLGAGLFTDALLTNTQKLTKAENQLTDALRGGFEEGSRLVLHLRESISILKSKIEIEEKEAAVAKKAANERAGHVQNAKAENAEYKKLTDERIKDAERLQTALRTAFSESIKLEKDYLSEAKKLRAEASGKNKPAADDPDAQAIATAEAVAAAMKLQRTAATASLESVREQSEELRVLAGRLADVGLAESLRTQANLAEAKALERAAKEEGARVDGLADQMNKAERETSSLKSALDGVGKPVSVEINAGASVDATNAKLEKTVTLMDQIISKNRQLGNSFGGLDTEKLSSGMASLQTTALQYGRRP